MSITLIDTIRVVSTTPGQGEVSSPQTSVTFGASGDGYAQAAIDGTSLKEYLCKGIIRTNASSATYTFRPNGLTTTQYAIGINSSSSVSSFQTSAMHLLGGGLTTPVTIAFEFNFWSEDGVIRPYLALSMGREDGTSTNLNDYRLRQMGGTWEGTATVLSSIDIVSSVSNAIGADSYFRLYEIDGSLA